MKTEYIYWDPGQGYQADELRYAAEILRSGGLVAFPTETVYGLGGNGLLRQAAMKIYAAKGRPSDNPLILHISRCSELDAVVGHISVQAEALMDAFWPGPMTLVFRKSDAVPPETTGGLDTVAVRMPAHAGARALIREAGVPVAAPSANLSGRPSPTEAGHVREDLDGRIDMIIDGGSVGIGLESTIIDLTEEVPVILRPGYITREMIAQVTGAVVMDPGLETGEQAIKPKAPGMKYRHYAPRAVMTVFEGDIIDVVAEINARAAEYPEDKVGILATEETRDHYVHGQVLVAGSRKDHTIAHGLYAALRQFDHLGVEVIFSESFSGEDRSEAIMNRLRKAAGQRIEFLPK
jgi:Sua5/YciO/YrdC/YwlC family protein